MMKTALLKTHYSPEEAYSLLMVLDALRESLWQNYREEIVHYCQHNAIEEGLDFIDDEIPF